MYKNIVISAIKRLIIILIIFLTVVFIAYISFIMYFISKTDDHLSKNEIFELVNKNYTILYNEIQNKNLNKSYSIEGIKEINFREDNNYNRTIDFYCGGMGMGSDTSYYGFYYNENDILTDIWCSGTPLQKLDNGYYYKQTDGDNIYYTEQIKGHFYYYEAHY